MKAIVVTGTLAGMLLLSGCVSLPTGPSVMALPGTGKTFDQFRADDAACRQYAFVQVGGATANKSAVDAGVTSAVAGTLIGAAAGAAIGGHEGAGVGAGTGLLVGSMAGTDAAQQSGYGSQRRYDYAYIQCMYAKGERVPVPASMVQPGLQDRGAVESPRYRNYPPPPRGNPPPPPPDY